MKIFKKVLKAIIFIPITLIALVITFEIIGMIINHAATVRQTRTLQNTIQKELASVEIIDTYSETGNTSGTGNHVDMLSVVLFKTEDNPGEIEDKLKEYYVFDEWTCFIVSLDTVKQKQNEGFYSFANQMNIPTPSENSYFMYLNQSAPFADNIVGH